MQTDSSGLQSGSTGLQSGSQTGSTGSQTASPGPQPGTTDFETGMTGVQGGALGPHGGSTIVPTGPPIVVTIVVPTGVDGSETVPSGTSTDSGSGNISNPGGLNGSGSSTSTNPDGQVSNENGTGFTSGMNSNSTNNKYKVMEGSIFNCPEPGFYPYETNCLDFYVCLEVLPGVLFAEQLYRCPGTNTIKLFNIIDGIIIY